MEDLHRLVMAIGGCALLCLLALLTWIAVRIDQGVRLLRPPPAPPAEACKRLHVSDLAWYQRVPGARRDEPYMTDLELPGFRSDAAPAVDVDKPARRPRPRRPVDEDEVNPTFPARPKR